MSAGDAAEKWIAAKKRGDSAEIVEALEKVFLSHLEKALNREKMGFDFEPGTSEHLEIRTNADGKEMIHVVAGRRK